MRQPSIYGVVEMKKAIILSLVICLVLCGCSRDNGKVDDTEKQLSEIAEKLGVISDALEEELSKKNHAEEDVVFEGETSEGEFPEDDFVDDDVLVEQTSSFARSEPTSAKEKAAKTDPTSVEEIVEYFSSSANSVKKDKPGFVIIETPTVGEVSIGKGSSTFVNAIKSAAMKFVKPSEKKANKGEDHSVFPVEGESWACKIEPSFVKKAECKKSGGYYIISIYLKDETLPDLPKKPTDCQTGKVVNVQTQEQIGDILGSIPLLKINKFSPSYSGCYVTCKINAKTGKMVEGTYYMNNIVTIHANNSIEASVDFAIRQEIKVNY